MDAATVGVLLSIGPVAPRRFPGFRLLPRRCMSPLTVHDEPQCYANPRLRATAGCPLWVKSGHVHHAS